LIHPAASTSKWDAADYAKVGAFVAELGGAALDLLDPKPGERILDVGCGEGTLTKRIVERGATVLGIDNSPEMIAAAREKGVDALLLAAEDMQFFAEFDAAFSNATCTGSFTRSRPLGQSSAHSRPVAGSPARWAARTIL